MALLLQVRHLRVVMEPQELAVKAVAVPVPVELLRA